MAGTREGGLKSAEKIKKKDPNFYRVAGSLGGKKVTANTKKRGFGSNRELARMAGAKGGSSSKRGKANGTSKET